MLFGLSAACSSTIPTATMPLWPHFETEVTIGGEPLRMVWDTGSQGFLLGTAAAERLHLPAAQPDHGMQIVDANKVARDVQQFVRLDDLRVGATRFDPFDTPTLPLPPQFPCDGIVGMGALLAAAWIVDAPARRLCMLDATHLDAGLAAAGYAVEARVPLRIDNRRPFVRVRLEDQQEVELLLDTGSRSTHLTMAVVESLALPSGEAREQQELQRRADELRASFEKAGVQVTDLKAETGGSIGLHGVQVGSKPFLLQRLALGGREFTDLCVYSKGNDGAKLGEDVLGRFPWAVHWGRSELLVLRPRDVK